MDRRFDRGTSLARVGGAAGPDMLGRQRPIGLNLSRGHYWNEFDIRYPRDVGIETECQIRKFHENHKHPSGCRRRRRIRAGA